MSISAFNDHAVVESGSPILTVTSSGTLDYPLVQHDDHGGTASPQGIVTRYHVSLAVSGYIQIPQVTQREKLVTIVNLGPTVLTVRNADGSTMGTLAAAASSSTAWIECAFGGLTWTVVRSAGWTAV
jgi:hypothetical protein